MSEILFLEWASPTKLHYAELFFKLGFDIVGYKGNKILWSTINCYFITTISKQVKEEGICGIGLLNKQKSGLESIKKGFKTYYLNYTMFKELKEYFNYKWYQPRSNLTTILEYTKKQITFRSPNIISTIRGFKNREINILKIEKSYYDELYKSVPSCRPYINDLIKYNIQVDYKENIVLELRVFTKATRQCPEFKIVQSCTNE